MSEKLTEKEIKELRTKKQAIKEEHMKFLDWWKEFSRCCPVDITDSEMAKQAWEAGIQEGIEYDKISRVEVIGSEGREYVRYFKDDEYMDWDLQDDDRTLKIFIKKNDDDR